MGRVAFENKINHKFLHLLYAKDAIYTQVYSPFQKIQSFILNTT